MTEGILHLSLSQSRKVKVNVSAAARSIIAQASQNGLRVTSMDLGLCLDGLPLPTPMHRCSYFFHPLPIIKSSEPTPLHSITYPLVQTIELSRLNHLYQAHKCNASDEPSRRHVGHRIFRPLFNGRFVLQCTYSISFFNINPIKFS